MLDRAPAPDAAPILADEAAALLARAFDGARHVLLAVSGGADSTALLALAAGWSDAPRLSIATVHQGLRPEAAEEAVRVADLAGCFGLPHATLPAPISSETRVEAAAREARYAVLFAHARTVGADAVATAHTLDDQAETVLMRLAAGSGPAGLAAMRPETLRDGLRHVRPFLGVPKSRLVATLRAGGLSWSEDAMNMDPRFARARLRASRDVLSGEGLTPERLARLARRMARAETALKQAVADAAVSRLTRDARGRLVIARTEGLPQEILLRLLARAIADLGFGAIRLERLERLLGRVLTDVAGAATLGGARIAWGDGRVVVSPAPPRRDGARGSQAV